MSAALIILVTIAYACVAINETWKANFPLALVFGGYAVANVGLIVGLKAW